MIPSVCLFIPFLSEILWKYNDSSKSLQNKAGDWLYKTKKLAIPSEGATNKIVDIDTAKAISLDAGIITQEDLDKDNA